MTVRLTFLAVLVSLSGSAASQSATRFGDAVVVENSTLADTVQAKSVRLYTFDGTLGLYVFCIDSRTPNVSVYFPSGSFANYGYANGARIPVTWQADNRQKVNELWQVIGQNDDLRRYGKLGLITAELFKTQYQFKLKLLEKQFTFSARGMNSAMKQLPCVVPFLRATGYIR